MDRPGDPVTGTLPDVATWANSALVLLGGLPDVVRAGLGVVEGGGRRLRFTADDRDNDPVPDWCHVDAYDDVPLNTAVRTSEPVTGSLAELEDFYAAFVERQRGTSTVAMAAVPIIGAGRTLGGYALSFDRLQGFDAAQRSELALLGHHLGEGLCRAQRLVRRPALAFSDEPVPAGAVAAVHDVSHDISGVARARHFLQEVLRAWGIGEEEAFTASVCLSELVTNALVHAHADCVVRVMLAGRVLTTTVRDRGLPSGGLAGTADDPMRVHGRGLQLVDGLADRWGTTPDPTGTTSWFVLEV
jgi:anti-sigma regulatory factor (Ser/Thr protein kinase)